MVYAGRIVRSVVRRDGVVIGAMWRHLKKHVGLNWLAGNISAQNEALDLFYVIFEVNKVG